MAKRSLLSQLSKLELKELARLVELQEQGAQLTEYGEKLVNEYKEGAL